MLQKEKMRVSVRTLVIPEHEAQNRWLAAGPEQSQEFCNGGGGRHWPADAGPGLILFMLSSVQRRGMLLLRSGVFVKSPTQELTDKAA